MAWLKLSPFSSQNKHTEGNFSADFEVLLLDLVHFASPCSSTNVSVKSWFLFLFSSLLRNFVRQSLCHFATCCCKVAAKLRRFGGKCPIFSNSVRCFSRVAYPSDCSVFLPGTTKTSLVFFWQNRHSDQLTD